MHCPVLRKLLLNVCFHVVDFHDSLHVYTIVSSMSSPKIFIGTNVHGIVFVVECVANDDEISGTSVFGFIEPSSNETFVSGHYGPPKILYAGDEALVVFVDAYCNAIYGRKVYGY